MDVNGLAVAWLSAVRRTQSQPIPGAERASADRDRLTNVIERALRAAGPDSEEPDWIDPLRPGTALDVTV